MRLLSDFLSAVDIQESYCDLFVNFASCCFAEIAHHIQEFYGRGIQALQYRIMPWETEIFWLLPVCMPFIFFFLFLFLWLLWLQLQALDWGRVEKAHFTFLGDSVFPTCSHAGCMFVICGGLCKPQGQQSVEAGEARGQFGSAWLSSWCCYKLQEPDIGSFISVYLSTAQFRKKFPGDN